MGSPSVTAAFCMDLWPAATPRSRLAAPSVSAASVRLQAAKLPSRSAALVSRSVSMVPTPPAASPFLLALPAQQPVLVLLRLAVTRPLVAQLLPLVVLIPRSVQAAKRARLAQLLSAISIQRVAVLAQRWVTSTRQAARTPPRWAHQTPQAVRIALPPAPA